jgi:FMN-dependent NADH-azoreductase
LAADDGWGVGFAFNSWLRDNGKIVSTIRQVADMNESPCLSAPSGKTLVFLNTPFSYVETPLCPLDIMSVNTLKLISYLKKRGNDVHFINMRSRESYQWKEVSAGRDRAASVHMRIMGKPRRYLLDRLQGMAQSPDEIWISCVFSFDYEIVLEMIDVCRSVFPTAKIVVGGDFIRNAPELVAELPAIVYAGRIEEADLAEPDFSVIDNWEYGIFQLTMGCPHHCSFCVAGMDPPRVMDVDSVIAYMKAFDGRYQPSVFWNWDPNVLVFREKFDEFLDKFALSGIKAPLRFGKGFQPNLMTESLIRKMSEVATIGASLPIETADSVTIQRYKKPYSIISSVKMLSFASRYKFDLGSSQCTFVIGYPEDNFASIFRAYLTALILGGKPTPFPVFLFPYSEDYERYREVLRGKSLAELHGQRWPLIESVDVPKYQNLLRFLLMTDLAQASRHLSLLTPDLAEAYQRERYLIDDFIALCQAAPRDSLEELKTIEARLEEKKRHYRSADHRLKILYIVANPKSTEKSITRQLGSYFLERLQEKSSACEIQTIDLYKEQIPFISEEYVDATFKDVVEVSEETAALIRRADRYIAMLRQADKIVIACPMWTFSIPSILKAFLEIVTSRLFYYYHLTIDDKPVLCILARHGKYIPPAESGPSWRPKFMNSQEPSLISAFQLMGVVRGLHFVCAEGLHLPENRQSVIDRTKQELDVLAGHF